MDSHRVGIIIPAFNESNTVKNVVSLAGRFGKAIVVDDGSIDQTEAYAIEAGAIVVKHDKNYGYDAAINSGFKKAKELGLEIVLTVDADGQHSPFLIPQFIREIELGADIVLGVRSNKQRITEHIFAWYSKKAFGVEDPLCGMKAYRMDIYAALGHFDSYGSVGTELMFFAIKNKYKTKQIFFNVIRRKGKSRFGHFLLANYKIARSMIFSFFWVQSKQ